MKNVVAFGLKNAAWPALLVGPDGHVFLANAAAKSVFGSALNAESPALASIWAAENGGSPAEFLARWEQSPAAMSLLQFRTGAGAVAAFTTAICQFTSDDKKMFVVQLLPEAGAVPGTAGDKSAAAGDAALKQKLDCVLQ